MSYRINPDYGIPDEAVRAATRRIEKPFGKDEYVVLSDPLRDWRMARTARGQRMMYYRDNKTYLGPFPTKARAKKSQKRAHQIYAKLGSVGMLPGTFGFGVIHHSRVGSVRPPGYYVEVEQIS